MRELPDDGLEPLAPHNVAVGDAEHLPPPKPPQGRPHDLGVVAATNLRGECCREQLFALGAAATHANVFPGLGVGDHRLGEKRTGREDRQQHPQAVRVAVEERGGGERAADRCPRP